MQIGESVSVNLAKTLSMKCPMEPHDEDNFFEQGKRPEQKSVADLRKAMKNGVSTIRWVSNGDKYSEGENEGPKQLEPDKLNPPIEICEKEYELSVAAHHLIPGKASLPKSSIAKYIWASEGNFVKGDAGYDVDGSENGLWMPTHQVMSRAMGKAKRTIFIHDYDTEDTSFNTEAYTWKELSEKVHSSDETEETYSTLFLQRYTQQAMIGMNTQFHDAHSDYNTYVIKMLGGVELIMKDRIGMCDKCKEKGKPYLPAYRIGYYLNSISHRLRRMLSGSPSRQWTKVYTSNFAKKYYKSPLPKTKLKG